MVRAGTRRSMHPGASVGVPGRGGTGEKSISKTLLHLLSSGLSIRPIDHTAIKGSYVAALLHVLFITGISTAITAAFFFMHAGPEDLPPFALKYAALFAALLVLTTLITSSVNCYFLGLAHGSTSLDWHIVVASFTYVPFLVLMKCISVVLGSIISMLFWSISVTYIKMCYSHVALDGERDALLHYVFLTGCIIISTLFLLAF